MDLDAKNALKTETVADWITQVCPGAEVLDTCCANGAFSFTAAKAGSRQVTGFDYEQGRIDVAQLVATLLAEAGAALPVEFEQLDAYDIAEHYEGRDFDVSLCLGSLYHLADPPHILRQIRSVTTGWLIVQTSQILPNSGNHAEFRVRSDRTGQGLSSFRSGNGAWQFSVPCFRELLAHGGFEIVEERERGPRLGGRRLPWYAALAKAI